MNEENVVGKEDYLENNKKSEALAKGLFLASIGGVSALVAFSSTLASTKKNNPVEGSVSDVYESGQKLAVKALKVGTLYAVSGCVLFFGIFWSLSNIKEFKEKLGRIFPQIPKNTSGGRTDFESLTEFMKYLNDEYSSKSK